MGFFCQAARFMLFASGGGRAGGFVRIPFYAKMLTGNIEYRLIIAVRLRDGVRLGGNFQLSAENARCQQHR